MIFVMAYVTPVSIHTPVWGVTVFKGQTEVRFNVSIHTPVWGVTYSQVLGLHTSWVSIHTPVWGVTTQHFLFLSALFGFNPHARVGRDSAATSTFTNEVKFQSTRPCGA